MLNLAFRPTQSRTPTTTFSDHQFIHLSTTENALNSFRHMTLDALKSILSSICTFTIYLLVMLIDVCILFCSQRHFIGVTQSVKMAR